MMVMKKQKSDKIQSIWNEGFFAETVSGEDVERRMKTFHKSHDEDMNFNCKKCGRKISAHNKDWHDEMCDECFDAEYFCDD